MRLRAAVERGDEFDTHGGGGGERADAAGAAPVDSALLHSVLPDALRALEAAEVEPEDEEEEGEGSAGGFDVGALMAQMVSVRQAAVAGGMTDEARREAAAAMVARLMRLMGEDGDPAELLSEV